MAKSIRTPEVGEVIAGCKFLGKAGTNERGLQLWRLECECGAVIPSRAATLQIQAHNNGRKRLCGDTIKHRTSRSLPIPSQGEVIAGCKFVRLEGRNNNNDMVWRMLCPCGEEFSRIASQQLFYHRQNKERLCGDQRRHACVEVGNRYGRLTVLELISTPAYSKQKGHHQKTKARCECECGNTTAVWPYGLISGNTQSCGCYRTDRIKEAKTTHGLSNTQQQYMFSQAKGRAKDRGLEFNLDIHDCAIPEVCPYLGIPIEQFKKGDKQTGRARTANSPSLDRINPALGYTKENAIVCSWRANDIKGDATLEELKELVAGMQRVIQEREAEKTSQHPQCISEGNATTSLDKE